MNWKRGSTIGRGSTATVSLAVSADSGELFAAKSAELSLSGPLRREQSVLSKLDSPYVVKYKGFDVTTEEDEIEYYNLFTEYHPRGTLSDEIRRRGGGRLGEPAIRRYAWEILQGLEYLHANGIVHCDIKSSNVLVGPHNVVISDLGCSIDHGSVVFCGTPMFMAPEVVLGQGQGFESDIWSLGCTVVEMASGKSPWPEVRDPVSALYRIGFSGESPEIPGWLSPEGKDFLGACLKRDPRERLTARELQKHPFFDGLSSGFDEKDDHVNIIREVSPRSVLLFDQSVWEYSSSDHHRVAERIERLIVDHHDVSLFASSSSDWSLDTQDWITVRSNETSTTSTDYEMFLSLGVRFVNSNNIIISPRKRYFTLVDQNDDHVTRNLKLKKSNENYRSLQYLPILSSF